MVFGDQVGAAQRFWAAHGVRDQLVTFDAEAQPFVAGASPQSCVFVGTDVNDGGPVGIVDEGFHSSGSHGIHNQNAVSGVVDGACVGQPFHPFPTTTKNLDAHAFRAVMKHELQHQRTRHIRSVGPGNPQEAERS